MLEPYVGHVAPDLRDRMSRWTGEEDVFAAHRIDEQLAKALDRKVWLPSGGSLVIDRTEAMIVVDVNTGKFTGAGGNLEETVTKNNLEAAEEIVRQLRLRDLGGIIVIDFIDMVLESNRDLVLRRLLECLGRDRTKHQVAEVTSLGLVQMTRKRVGQGLLEVVRRDLRALQRPRLPHPHRAGREATAATATAAASARAAPRRPAAAARSQGHGRSGGGAAEATEVDGVPGGRRGPGRAGRPVQPPTLGHRAGSTTAAGRGGDQGPAAPPQGQQPGHDPLSPGRRRLPV